MGKRICCGSYRYFCLLICAAVACGAAGSGGARLSSHIKCEGRGVEGWAEIRSKAREAFAPPGLIPHVDMMLRRLSEARGPSIQIAGTANQVKSTCSFSTFGRSSTMGFGGKALDQRAGWSFFNSKDTHTSLQASTISGTFTRGFSDPEDDGQASWSETEGVTVRIADCKMPTNKGMFRLRSYKHQSTKRVSRDGEQVVEWVDMEPVVLYKGFKDSALKENVLVRVHDQCFTSEVLGSRRCDCREQLELAMKAVQEKGGAIIYLPQEGRGIGLANKIAAYQLQDKGLDTVDANRRLGFEDDERVYGCVPFILKDLGIESVQLMTNNPFKIKQLTDLGVNISSVTPSIVQPNQYNEGYLRTKAQRMAHAIFNFDSPSLDDGEGPSKPRSKKG